MGGGEALALLSHGHGHLVVLIPTVLLIKGCLGIVSIQLEGGVGRREGEWPRGQVSLPEHQEAPLELGAGLAL